MCALACTSARISCISFVLDIPVFSLDLHWPDSSTNDGNHEAHVHSIKISSN